MAIEIIEWHPTNEAMPDQGITVMVHAPESSEPVWLGYLDGYQWRWVDGSPVAEDVIAWAEIPCGLTVEQSRLIFENGRMTSGINRSL